MRIKKIEDVTRRRKLKKGRHYNGKKKEKTNNDK
jgi:hypothetical protein